MSVQRDRSTFCAIKHLYRMYLVLHFQRIQSLQHEIRTHSKVERSPFLLFLTLGDFPPFLALWDEIFFLFPHQLLIFCNRMDIQKSQRVPLYNFWHYATYRKHEIKFRKKKSERCFWIFRFLRTFVVSKCRKSNFWVFLSLRYCADLGRSRLVSQTRIVWFGNRLFLCFSLRFSLCSWLVVLCLAS